MLFILRESEALASPQTSRHLYNTYSPELSAFLLRRHGTHSLNYIPKSKPSHGALSARRVLFTLTPKQTPGYFHCRRTKPTDVASSVNFLLIWLDSPASRASHQHPEGTRANQHFRKTGASESCLHCQFTSLSEPGLMAVIFYCSHITRSYFLLVKLSLCHTIESN